MTLTATPRLTLSDLEHLSLGKRTRLRRLLGAPGAARVLAGAAGPESADPRSLLSLARDGGWSAVILPVGLATRYMREFAGQVPLMLQLNGPAESAGFAPCHASVEDAVRLGADAVGYLFHPGAAAQDHDFIQLAEVREEADRWGMPLVAWAHPRGRAVDEAGGPRAPRALAQAAWAAQEAGADVICLNAPTGEPGLAEAVPQLRAAAGQSLVWIAQGAAESSDALVESAAACVAAGAGGVVLGDAIWGLAPDEALKLSAALREKLG